MRSPWREMAFVVVGALGLALGAGAPAQPGAVVPGEVDDLPRSVHAAPPDDPHAAHPMTPDDPNAGYAMPEADPHAGHAMPEADPHAGHAMPEADPHAGHAMPEADPHAGHAMPEAEAHAGHAMPEAEAHAGHAAGAADATHAHHNMVVDAEGMVMNHNPTALPRDCAAVSEEVDLLIRAGREFARARPGWVYGYDQHVWNVKPCARVNVTLENRDAVRHQWMVHGLPRYLYPAGMFTLEVYGPGSRSASFIVPSASKTYLAHCDVPHHMEKGMKGQLVVGRGDGTLPSIPGVSAPLFADRYPARWERGTFLLVAVAAGLGAALSIGLRRS